MGRSHHYTKPYTPRTNGKAERVIQIGLCEWAYARTYHRSRQRRASLPSWLRSYNWHGNHVSLAGRPLISLLRLTRENLSLDFTPSLLGSS